MEGSSEYDSDTSCPLVMDLPTSPPHQLPVTEEQSEEEFNCLDLDSQCSKGILTTVASGQSHTSSQIASIQSLHEPSKSGTIQDTLGQDAEAGQQGKTSLALRLGDVGDNEASVASTSDTLDDIDCEIVFLDGDSPDSSTVESTDLGSINNRGGDAVYKESNFENSKSPNRLTKDLVSPLTVSPPITNNMSNNQDEPSTKLQTLGFGVITKDCSTRLGNLMDEMLSDSNASGQSTISKTVLDEDSHSSLSSVNTDQHLHKRVSPPGAPVNMIVVSDQEDEVDGEIVSNATPVSVDTKSDEAKLTSNSVKSTDTGSKVIKDLASVYGSEDSNSISSETGGVTVPITITDSQLTEAASSANVVIHSSANGIVTATVGSSQDSFASQVSSATGSTVSIKSSAGNLTHNSAVSSSCIILPLTTGVSMSTDYDQFKMMLGTASSSLAIQRPGKAPQIIPHYLSPCANTPIVNMPVLTNLITTPLLNAKQATIIPPKMAISAAGLKMLPKLQILLSNKSIDGKVYTPPSVPDHLQITDASVHKCSQCLSEFQTQGGFQQHMKRRTMKLVYKCPLCKFSTMAFNKCAWRQSLSNHECSQKNNICIENCDIQPISAADMGKQYADMCRGKKTLASVSSDVVTVPSEDDCSSLDVNASPVAIAPDDLPPPLRRVVDTMIQKSKNYDPKTSKLDLKEYLELRILLNFCMECGAFYNCKSGLQQHFVPKVKHSVSYECDLCMSVLPTKCAYAAHIRIHNREPPFVCPECGDCMFESRQVYMRHVKNACFHFSRKSCWQCPLCESKFGLQECLKKHILSAHAETYTKCLSCPMAFKSVDNFHKHNSDKHSNEAKCKLMTKCPFCTVAENLGNDGDHLMDHIKDFNAKIGHTYSYQCIECPAQFNAKHALICHIRTQHSKSALVKGDLCRFCGIECPWLQTLSAHMATEHKLGMMKVRKEAVERLKDLVCPHCSLFLRSRDAAEAHVKKCPQQLKKLICPVEKEDCGSVEDSNHDVKTSDCCEVEEKINAYKSTPPASIQTPVKSPKEELKEGAEHYQFECTQCQTVFEDSAIFKRHQGRHKYIQRMKLARRSSESGISNQQDSPPAKKSKKETEVSDNGAGVSSPPRAGLVNKNTAGTAAVNKPSSPEPRYACFQCDFIFFEAKELEEHLKTVHGIAPTYSCHLCGETYYDKGYLVDHIHVSHGGKAKKKMYTCCLCKEKGEVKTYYVKISLVGHLRTHKVTKAMMDNFVKRCLDDNKIGNSQDTGLSPEGPQIKRLKLAEDKNYSCAKCDFISSEHGQFLEHIVKHKMDKDSVQCEECGLCFMALPSLERHLVAVHKVRDVETYIAQSQVDENSSCPLLALDLSNIKPTKTSGKQNITPRKIKPEMPEVDDPLQCRVCYKVLENNTQLKKHLRSHGMAFVQSRRLSNSVKANFE